VTELNICAWCGLVVLCCGVLVVGGWVAGLLYEEGRSRLAYSMREA